MPIGASAQISTLIYSKDPARITDSTLIGTTYYYKLLTLMASYARLLDKSSEAEALEREAAQVNAAFQKKFFKPASSVYDNGPRLPACSRSLSGWFRPNTAPRWSRAWRIA